MSYFICCIIDVGITSQSGSPLDKNLQKLIRKLSFDQVKSYQKCLIHGFCVNHSIIITNLTQGSNDATRWSKKSFCRNLSYIINS